MDLRLLNKTARNAVIWILNGIWLILLLWATGSQSHAAEATPDYLLPNEALGGAILAASSTESDAGTSGSAVSQYQAFDGAIHSLREAAGKHVSVLLPTVPPDGPYFTEDHIEELVDRLDVLYELYRDLLHREPQGSGRLTVAFVPDTCGMGCGLLGAKGIEILSHPLNYENIIRELDTGHLEKILVHEMVHNFDTFARYIHYLPDHAHAWTDMFEFFAPYRYARDSRNNKAPDDVFDSPIRTVWRDYVLDDSADWEVCVRQSGCLGDGLTANSLWAMLYYRVEAIHGSEALLRSFDFLSEFASKNMAPATDEEKEGLRILSLAVGAQANIACYLDQLRWPLTDDVRSEMTRRFGSSQAFCQDADGDGFSAITGDCDDRDPARHILSSEIPGNGQDDDCDEQIDEQRLVENPTGGNTDRFGSSALAVTLPFEVEGGAQTTEDSDIFRFDLTPTRRVRATLCADGTFRGWVVALGSDGRFLEADHWNGYQPGPGCTGHTFDFGELEQGRLQVLPDDASGHYSLIVSEAVELPSDLSASVRTAPRSDGRVDVTVTDPEGRLADIGTDEIEFWVSGAGFRDVRPFVPGQSLALFSGQLQQTSENQIHQVRIRPRKNGTPLAAFSAGHRFRFPGGSTQLTAVDGGVSGLWYDPDHDGEGFLVEVLDDGWALVYWFTYHRDGRQRWFIGLGTVSGNRIDVDELLDTHGGRFGPNFDPSDVERTVRGSLSLSFSNCREAIVNYSVDGIGGHLPLTRLTGVFGHGCGQAETPHDLDLSGSWYDPAHDGEGFVVQEYEEGQALAFYFTYDQAGNQAWMFNTGTVTDGRLSVPDLLQPTGGRFGRSYDPESVELLPWGRLEMTLDCDRGPGSYASTQPGFPAGSQNLVRLTRLANSGCAPR